MDSPASAAARQPFIPLSWWVGTGIFLAVTVCGGVFAWRSSEVAQEIMAKALMTLVGTLSSPFILETSFACLGLILVLTFNEYRKHRDGPDWVLMEVDEEAPGEKKS
jgi:hypothetical protein